MSHFIVDIELGNDAMNTPGDVAGALFEVATKIQAGQTAGSIKDRNGNSVGFFQRRSGTIARG